MANAPCFLLLQEWEEVFKILNAEQSHSLVLAMFALQGRGEKPCFDDPLLKMAWLQISGSFERIIEAKAQKSAKARESAERRWNANASIASNGINNDNANECESCERINRMETHSEENANECDAMLTNTNANANANANRMSSAADDESPAAGAGQAKAKPDPVAMDYQAMHITGITDEQVAAWQQAYPAISVRQEIAKAEAWLFANPANRKKNVLRFLVSWFSRAQDKAPRVARSPASRQTLADWKRECLGGGVDAYDKEKFNGF